MAQNWRDAFRDFYHFDVCPSSQTFLLQLKRPFVFCRANTQTAGVGQQARPWHSPRGQLLFSFSYLLAGDAALHRGLAQWTALNLIQLLEALFPQHLWQLKWPNDVYFNGKKIAGILIDAIQQKDSLQVVVGLGLNLNADGDFIGLNQTQYDADALLDLIMPRLLSAYALWQEKPYLPNVKDWAKYDMFFQQKINMEDGKSGSAFGMDQKGRLILKTETQIHYLEQGRICIS